MDYVPRFNDGLFQVIIKPIELEYPELEFVVAHWSEHLTGFYQAVLGLDVYEDTQGLMQSAERWEMMDLMNFTDAFEQYTEFMVPKALLNRGVFVLDEAQYLEKEALLLTFTLEAPESELERLGVDIDAVRKYFHKAR
jgi:hypothetical protein